jgi:IS1 family transposase/transposase-like protein
MECIYCKGQCIKSGKYKTTQRYQCKDCKRYQQDLYTKYRIPQEKYERVKDLSNEGNGISSISRLEHISKSSVLRIIIRISSKIKETICQETNQTYEIDELRTFCGDKANECWVIYAINKTTGKVVDFVVGRRTKTNIKQVIDSILALNPKSIYTDRLNIYPSLIPKSIHKVFQYCTNKIERHNLTLRTHVKRLNRKSICFTKSTGILYATLNLYWRGR